MLTCNATLPGTCESPLFWWLNPPKQGPFQPKQGSFGFQVYTKGGHSSVKKIVIYTNMVMFVRPAQPDRVLCLSPLRRLNDPQVRRFHFQVKMQSMPGFGPLLEVRMSKNLHTVAAFVARSNIYTRGSDSFWRSECRKNYTLLWRFGVKMFWKARGSDHSWGCGCHAKVVRMLSRVENLYIYI